MEKVSRAKKQLGQNFLNDATVVSRIINAAAPLNGKAVIEIGPGRGALTSSLLSSGANVLAIEFDKDLIPHLQSTYGRSERFRLIQADALEVDLCSLLSNGKAVVIANLPYYISTAILRLLIKKRRCLDELILMLQREVVDRILAPPGHSERGFLSVLVQAFCRVEPLFDVSPASFQPRPKVWSTVARFRFQNDRFATPESAEMFEALISCSFGQKRKTLTNNLKTADGGLTPRITAIGGPQRLLNAAGISLSARAEELEMADWERIVGMLLPSSLAPPDGREGSPGHDSW